MFVTVLKRRLPHRARARVAALGSVGSATRMHSDTSEPSKRRQDSSPFSAMKPSYHAESMADSVRSVQYAKGKLDKLRYPLTRVSPFAVSRLAQKVTPKHRQHLEEIFACVDGALHLHYAKFGQSLLALYSPFEPSSTKSTQVVSVDSLFPAAFCPVDDIIDQHKRRLENHSGCDEDRDDEKEDSNLSRSEKEVNANHRSRANIFRMTSCFLWLARRAAFQPVSALDQKICEQNTFLMTTPVKVAWNYFDGDAMTFDGKTHYDQFEDPNYSPPSFASRLVVLKRGRGMTRTSGYFIGEKIDEITRRLFVNTVQTVKRSFRNTFHIKRTAKTKTSQPMTQRGPRRWFRSFDEFVSETESASAWSTLDMFSVSTLLGKITLEEPSFEDIFLVMSPEKWREEDEVGVFDMIFGRRAANRKPAYDLHLSHFRKVPRSDMELIFPSEALRVALRPSLLVNYTLVSFGAIVLSASLLWHGVHLTLAGLVASSGVILYVSRASFKYYMSRLYYKSAVTQYLQDNCIATNRAAIHTMLHEARQQDFRCAAIVCCVFWADESKKKNEVGGPSNSAGNNCDAKSSTLLDEEDNVLLGDLTTKTQRQWHVDDLIDVCKNLAKEYDIASKVVIDEERISNVLHWLHIHGIATVEGNIITPQNIEEVHRNRDVYIHLAMADHQHMWRSLAMMSGDADADLDQRPPSSIT